MSPLSQVPFGLIDAQSSFLHMVTFPDGTTEKEGLKGQSWKRKDMGGHVRIVSFMDCRKHDQPCVRPLVSMSTVAKWLKHQNASVVLLRLLGAVWCQNATWYVWSSEIWNMTNCCVIKLSLWIQSYLLRKWDWGIIYYNLEAFLYLLKQCLDP